MSGFLFDFHCIPSFHLSTFSKYLSCNFNDLELGQLQVIRSSRVKIYSVNQKLIDGFLSDFIVSNTVSLTVYNSRYLTRKSCDLYLGQFRIIRGQKSWCQLIAHRWFFLSDLLRVQQRVSRYFRHI